MDGHVEEEAQRPIWEGKQEEKKTVKRSRAQQIGFIYAPSAEIQSSYDPQ